MTLLPVALALLGFLGLAQCCPTQDNGTNIARNGTADQSSQLQIYDASRAIDGNPNTWWFADSCTATSGDYQPWWRLNLTQVYKIAKVVITNRFDDVPQRLMCAELRIGNNPNNNNPLCGIVSDISKPNMSFCCYGMEGLYVSVVIPGRSQILTLCEVEVYSAL